jgi:multiple sugar transport system substrate-binding protein
MAQENVKLQVSVWLGDAEFKAMQELGKRFTDNHPNVEIEYINIVDGGPFGRDKLQQMIAGGTPPDIMMLNTGQFEAFGSRDALAALDDRIAAESYDLSIYWPPAVEGIKIDGKTYGLPKDISDHVVYLNTDLFAAAGVELPADEWTWDDFRDIAKQLTVDTDGDGNVDQWGTSIVNGVWSWGSFVITNGGQVLNDDRTECLLNSPEALEALNVYYGYLTADAVSVPPGTLPQTPGSFDQFNSGITAMQMAGPWFRPGLVENKPFNWTLRLYPRPGADAPTSILYTDQWGMSSDTKHPDEAWELLKFLGGAEGQTIWSEIYGSRSITPIKELALSDKWMTYGGEEHRPDNQTILDQLERTVPPPINFGDGAEVDNVWDEQFDLVMAGQQSVEQAVESIVDQVNRILQQ